MKTSSKWRKLLELNHWRAEDKPNFSSMQKRWRGCQTTLCTKSSKIPQKQIERRSMNHLTREQQKEHADIHTSDAHVHLLTNKPKQLAIKNPKSWDQDNHPCHHMEGKPERRLWLWKKLTSAIQRHPGHTSTPMVQLKTPQETEVAVPTSGVQANLHSLCC